MFDDDVNTPTSTKRPRLGLKIALIGAGIAAGAIGATAIGANAATTAGSGTTSSAAASSATSAAPSGTTSGAPSGTRPGHDGHGGPGGPGGPGGHGGSAPVRSDEKAVSTADAATIKAAALKAVPGGTVYRIETDAGDGTYEAHMTKSDGSLATVKFGKDLKVTKVETGMGTGDPAPKH